MRKIFSLVIATALLVNLASLPASAQKDRSRSSVAASDSPTAPSPSALPGVFGEVLDVRVINIEVMVTDKRGTPILGLGAEDFELVVDGEPVEVDYFSEIRGGVALQTEGEPTPLVPSVAPGERVGTSYLLFIDEFFGLKPDRNTVLRSLKDDLAFLRPEDRMAVVAYDGEDLEMLSTWSQSQRALERVLNDAMLRPAQGLQRVVERKRYDFSTVQELEDLFGDLLDAERASAFATQLNPEERAYVQLVTEQVNRSVAAASATLRSFAKPPGRKVMILLSGGWPFIPADFLVSDVSRILFEKEGPYGANLYSRLVETANLLGYTLYPVDLPGLEGGAIDAETSGLPEPNASFNRTFLREREVQATLSYLAKETGGRALINSRRVGALESVSDDIESYYWLGFSPERARDDESHEVSVRLKNPDFRARSRGSFLDSSRETEVSMAVESTLLFGNAPAAGSLNVEVGPPVKAGKRRMEVPIRVAVPLSQVTVLPTAGSFGTQLELRVAVQDESGQQAPIPVIPLSLSFPTMPPEGAEGTYETRLLLRNRSHEAVVAIHDPASGRIFTTGFDIAPVD
ncbi:MAG: VWA domain-containing protein [Thermoanaerobaculia bacterium]